MQGSLLFGAVAHCFRTLYLVVFDLVRPAFLAAEILFLRKQLALFRCDPGQYPQP
jgi:hypothetical protein